MAALRFRVPMRSFEIVDAHHETADGFTTKRTKAHEVNLPSRNPMAFFVPFVAFVVNDPFLALP